MLIPCNVAMGQERPFANLYNVYSEVSLPKCSSLTVVSFTSLLAHDHELCSVYMHKEIVTLIETGFYVVTRLNEHNSRH